MKGKRNKGLWALPNVINVEVNIEQAEDDEKLLEVLIATEALQHDDEEGSEKANTLLHSTAMDMPYNHNQNRMTYVLQDGNKTARAIMMESVK